MHNHPNSFFWRDRMERQTESLLKQALTLNDAERAEMAAALLESLESPAEPGVEEAWRREIAARIEDLDSGRVATIPWGEVRERLWKRLNEPN
jgi:putative addiction module component (TIGR02574 family)